MSEPMQADSPLLISNARIRTLDAAGTMATAVAIADGRIVAVGGTEVAAAALPPHAPRIDLGGRTVRDRRGVRAAGRRPRWP